ncbi:hypothetical protein CP061683_1058, partial [Chlamydia psittaci 06-1683]
MPSWSSYRMRNFD